MKNSPTQLILGGAALIGLISVLWLLELPLLWLGIAIFFLVLEFWTLVNKFPNDTISEVIWKYRKRSIVPLGVGIAIGAATASGVLGDPRTVGIGIGIGGLAAHFFFVPETEEA